MFPKWYIMFSKASQDQHWLYTWSFIGNISLGFTFSLVSSAHSDWKVLNIFMFGPNVYISGTFSVYLRPNVYIYIQMNILMSNGCGFLCVIRVLQTVGPQIRVGGQRFGLFEFLHYFSDLGLQRFGLFEFLHYFSDLGLQTTHFIYIYARMCIFMTNLIKFPDIEGILRFCVPECALYTFVL